MAHDVFVSHSSKDKVIADAICNALESARIRCWIAPRDIRSGDKWAEAITNALTTSRIMVLIFSKNSNQSKQVSNELTLAMESEVIVIPFKIDNSSPSGVMRYYLSGTHWLDAMNPPTEKQIQDLVENVKQLLGEKANARTETRGTEEPSAIDITAPVQYISKQKRSFVLSWKAWLIAAVLLLGYLLIYRGISLPGQMTAVEAEPAELPETAEITEQPPASTINIPQVPVSILPSQIVAGVPTEIELHIFDPDLVCTDNHQLRISVGAFSDLILGEMIKGSVDHYEVPNFEFGGIIRSFEVGVLPLEQTTDGWQGRVTLTLPEDLMNVSISPSEDKASTNQLHLWNVESSFNRYLELVVLPE